MRVVYTTAPVPAANKQPPNDVLVDGLAYFEAVLYEPGDSTDPQRGRPVSYWLSTITPGQPFRLSSGPSLVGMPDVEIPATVLTGLPVSGRLDLRWHWTRKE